MSDIFISYKREDRAKVELLAQALQRLGWSVWWDRTIPAGQVFSKVIEKAIADARCMVVVWTRYSVDSSWVQEEAREGQERGVLIPVLADAVEPPLGFRSIQAADLTHWNGRDVVSEFERFVEDISIVIGPPPRSIEEERGLLEAEARAGETRQWAEAEARHRVGEERQRANLEAKRRTDKEQKPPVTSADGIGRWHLRKSTLGLLMITGVAVMAVGILLMKNIEKPVIRPPATPTHIESLNRYQTVNPRPEKPSVPESTAIARVVRAYYAAVQNKDVDGAISMYDPAKIPGPDRDLIARVAKDTEHYEIESIQVTPQGDACTSPDVVLLHLQSDACASADVVLHHKKVRGPEQTWDVHMTLVRRNASWKIWTMQ